MNDFSFLDGLDVPPGAAAEEDPAVGEKNFAIELSDFLFVTRGIKNGKALRFTVTWKFDHPQYGLLGASEEGWLAKRSSRGEFYVSPPINRFGPSQSKQLKTITVGLHDLIKTLLIKNGYDQHIGQEQLEVFRPKEPGEIDPTLPTEIDA